MPSSLAKKLCVALVLASSALSSPVAADDQHNDAPYVRSLKHSRRAAREREAGPSNLTKRGPTYNGRATYYAAGLGACGNYNSGSDFIVALNSAQYGNLGQVSSWCGKTIAITYNGNTQYAQVQDACPSCPYGGLDMSEGLFKAFASPSVGVFYMSWTVADGSGGDNNDDGNNNGGNQRQSSTSTTPAWTPRPSPTTTSSTPAYTPPPPTTTSSRARPTTTSSSSASSSSSSSSASSTSSASSASASASSQAEDAGANNLDSFALIYQGLNQMAVAAAS
ncbi:Expansin [Pseudozyma hubeiensis]|nr:Expansin [Pseudozyma hubeiensis]